MTDASPPPAAAAWRVGASRKALAAALLAALIAGASFVIGVDTGLVHIAAALGVPLVAIFIDSEPGLTGPMGGGPIAVVGGKGASPDPAEVLQALDRVVGRAAPTLPSPASGGGYIDLSSPARGGG